VALRLTGVPRAVRRSPSTFPAGRHACPCARCARHRWFEPGLTRGYRCDRAEDKSPRPSAAPLSGRMPRLCHQPTANSSLPPSISERGRTPTSRTAVFLSPAVRTHRSVTRLPASLDLPREEKRPAHSAGVRVIECWPWLRDGVPPDVVGVCRLVVFAGGGFGFWRGETAPVVGTAPA
jgi:hypothetical protein